MTEIKKKKHKYVSMEKEYKNNLILQIIFIVWIITLSAIFIYSSNGMFNAIYDDSTYKDLDSLGSQYNLLVQNKLNSQLSILEYNAKEIVEAQDKNVVMSRLKNIQDTTSFSYVSLLNMDGNVIDSMGKSYTYIPDYLNLIVNDNETIIGPLTTPDSKKEYILLAYPISEDGQITKILQGIYYLDDVDTNILPNDDNLIYGFIVDAKGSIIYGSNNKARMSSTDNIYDFYHDKDFKFGDDLTFEKFSKKVENKESFAYKIYYKGEVRYCHATPSNIQDWYTLSASAQAEGLSGLSETNARLNRYVFWFVLAIAFVLIIAFTIFKKQRTQVENMAFKDRLTGISTFMKFRTDAEELLAMRKGNYRLIAMDICAFKYLNEAYGFDKGNEVLKGFVEIIKPNLQEHDLFCRSNADVFLILTKNESNNLTIEDLDDQLSSMAYKIIGNDSRLSLSIGVYHIVDDVDITQIVDFANYARKKAKDNKSHKVLVYDENYKKTLQVKREITITMDRALKNKEFVPFIQPKVSLTTGNIIGGEILVRWIDENGVKHEPNEFIEVFEKNGFIVKLDLYMLEATCKVLNNLYEYLGNNKLKLSFNISRVSLFNANFIDDMIEICNQYNVKPSDIEIELTETVLSDESNRVMLAMEELKSAGFKLSIDDFGSKYSSLNILRTLPVDTIKIDKAFLYSDMLSDKALQIVESIIYLAKKLKLEIVVEGIENEIQYCQLKQMNCDVGQGFYFSKAITLDEFKELIEKSFLTPISNDVSSVMLSINRKLASKFIDNNKMECDYYDTLEFPALIIKVLADSKDRVNDAIISFANKNILKHFNFELNDLIGKSLSEFTGPLNSKWKSIFSKTAFEGERSKLIEYVDAYTQEFDIYVFQHNHGFITCFLNNIGVNSDSGSPHELLSNIQGGIITFKANEQGLLKEILYVGDGWEELSGYSKHDMIVNQTNFFDLIHPDDRAKVHSNYANCILNDSNWYVAYRIMKKNGKYIWVSDRGCVVSKGNSNVTIQCIFNDITKIKLNEIKLDKAYKLNHDLINNLQGGLIRYKINTKTKEAKMMYISEMWTQITGYNKENVELKLNATSIQTADKNFITEIIDNITDKIKSDNSFVIEYKIITYDGEERWIRDKGLVIDSRDNGDVEIQSVILDITSYKSFEMKININNARLINVIQATKSCLIEYEPTNLNSKYIINSFSVIGLGKSDDIFVKDSTGTYNINEHIYHPEDIDNINYYLSTLANNLSVSFKARVLNFKTNEYNACDVTYNLLKIYGESRIIVTIKLEE